MSLHDQLGIQGRDQESGDQIKTPRTISGKLVLEICKRQSYDYKFYEG